jgi:type I restriction enzyme, S subunit
MSTLAPRPIKDYCLGIYDGPHATPEESDEGPIFLGIKNITDDGRIDLSDVRHVSENQFPKWTRRVTPSAGDVVFTYEATLHRYAVIPTDFRGCLGRRVALVRPNTSLVDSRYLLYYFLSSAWRGVIEGNVMSGATVDRIPLERFPEFPVELPSLAVQKRVVAVLSNYDDLIENNRRRMALLEDSARQLYREWFVRLRFPGHEHTPIVDGVLQGWVKLPATEALEINPKIKLSDAEEHWFVEMANLPTDSMVIEGAYLREGRSGPKFQNGDTLFARITPCLENGKTGFVDFMDEGEVGRGSTEFIVLRSKRVTPEFVYCLSRTYEFRGNAIKSMIGSSGRQRVQESCFEKFMLNVPPTSLLRLFSDFAEPAFEEIKNLASQNQKLRQARDLLLPRLMNGELAV